MSNPECIFCAKDDPEINTIIAENDFAYARWDNFPVNPGHAEIVPIHHVESYFDLTLEESIAIRALTHAVRNIIIEKFHPDGFNIGVNDGEAAGRTIHHVHQHLIPRYIGDVANPRGGVRHIIPERGNY